MSTRATMAHARDLGYCVKGIRRWFDGRERNWLEFVEHGVDSDWLRATGDAMAIRLADLAEFGVRRSAGGRAMSRGGGKGKQSYTVGYWYRLGAHLALCHGPVDTVTEIRVGERVAWSGHVTGSTTITIDYPNLFGGEGREGGVQGAVDILMGEASQGRNAYLQSLLGNAIPAFRGVFSLVLKLVWVAVMNPYIKPWSVRAKRIRRKWNSSHAEIDGDANPAHIVRECLTNGDWGMDYPERDLDDASFSTAAATLYGEGFGLSLVWKQEEAIESFVLAILKHIDGVLYVHPRTGLFTLRLARADYTLARQPLFDPSNILRLEEFSRPSWGEVTNQVTVIYRDGNTDKDTSVTMQDLAGVQMTGSVVATSVNFPGSLAAV